MNVYESNRQSLPATTIVEVLVSAALIGIVLAALAVNMVYTQRTLENTYLRTKALDAAQSCLERFQASRDNLEWPLFCKAMTQGFGNLVKQEKIEYSGSAASPICGAYSVVGVNPQNYTYTVSFFPGSTTTVSGIGSTNKNDLKGTSYCRGDRSSAFYVGVRVYYNDALGNEKFVDLYKRFERGAMDAEYLP